MSPIQNSAFKIQNSMSFPVVIGEGSHPFPFRTRKLSSLPPMVLHAKVCGRVGHCRDYSSRADAKSVGPFFIADCSAECNGEYGEHGTRSPRRRGGTEWSCEASCVPCLRVSVVRAGPAFSVDSVLENPAPDAQPTGSSTSPVGCPSARISYGRSSAIRLLSYTRPSSRAIFSVAWL